MGQKALNELGRTYFSVPADMILRSSLELRMLEENRIEGLLTLTVCDDDGDLMLHYDTTGLETLSDILKERKADSADIRRIILGLEHVLSGLPQYLLKENGIVLQPDSVYADPLTLSPRFLFLPGRADPLEEGLSGLLQFLLSMVDHDDYNSVVLAYRLYKESLSGHGAIDRLEQILIAPEGQETNLHAHAGAAALGGMAALGGAAGPGESAYVVTADAERNLSADLSETVPLNTGIIRELPAEPEKAGNGKSGGFFGKLFRNKKEPPPDKSPAAEESEWLEIMDVRSGPHEADSRYSR